MMHPDPSIEPLWRSLSELIFDALAIRLKAEEVGDARVSINFCFTDIGEDWILGLQHGALHSVRGQLDPAADATITMTRAALLGIIGGDTTFVDAITSGTVTLEGNPDALRAIFAHLDTFAAGFAIIEP